MNITESQYKDLLHKPIRRLNDTLQDLRPKGRPESNKPPSISESAVLSACIRWLWYQGCFVWRNNSGAAKHSYTRKDGSHGESYIRYGFPGSADIIGVNPNGKFISIECKSPTGKPPTVQQRHFGARIVENGGIYIVARSIDDLEAHKAEILG